MNNNIILIGMPGVGKSTLGVILAKILGYCFCDTDLVIQETMGKLLKEIISDNGIDGFVETENRIISKLSFARSIVATGGSVVYGKDAMRNMKASGTVVYLKQSFEEDDNMGFVPADDFDEPMVADNLDGYGVEDENGDPDDLFTEENDDLFNFGDDDDNDDFDI